MPERSPALPDVSRAHRALPLAVIALAGLLAYANAFNGEFVFDDDTEIVTQPLIRDLGNFTRGWDAYRAYPNRVLVYFTFALNYATVGFDTRSWHITSVLIHLVGVVLAWSLALRRTRPRRRT